MKAVFDTNILIDYLNGFEAAKKELGLYRIKQISIITFIEVMVGSIDPKEEAALQGFLASFEVIDLSSAVAKEAVSIRKNFGLKIPDAIVYATARHQGCLLISRNTKDFKQEWPDVRIPYLIKPRKGLR